MKKVSITLCLLTLCACTVVHPAQFENMTPEQREKLAHFQDMDNARLCMIYTDTRNGIGRGTKRQVGDILKSREVGECFDDTNQIVRVQ